MDSRSLAGCEGALLVVESPGEMIVAGVRYGRDEVDAARRLLRELGQPEPMQGLGSPRSQDV